MLQVGREAAEVTEEGFDLAAVGALGIHCVSLAVLIVFAVLVIFEAAPAGADEIALVAREFGGGRLTRLLDPVVILKEISTVDMVG